MPADLRVLTEHAQLVEVEAGMVAARRQRWTGRLHDLGDYGLHGGGSASDRRRVVEAMASIERGEHRHQLDQAHVAISMLRAELELLTQRVERDLREPDKLLCHTLSARSALLRIEPPLDIDRSAHEEGTHGDR